MTPEEWERQRAERLATDAARIQQRTLEIKRAVASRKGTVVARHPAPPVDVILDAVAQWSRVSVENLRGPSRVLNVVLARHVAVYVGRAMGLSWMSAARMVNRGDHSTTHNAVRAVKKCLDADPVYAAEVRALVQRLDKRGAA